MRSSVSLYHRHRFPAEIISHCVWLYFRFALSFRDVEEMLAMRGVSLSYETIREWCLKFGQTYANRLRRKSARPGDRWTSGRSIPQDQWTHSLLMACRGSRWRRIGYSGPKQTRQEGCEEVLSQAYETTAVCASGNHHRSTPELQCGEDRNGTERRTSPTEVSEQPRREFASANEIARACNEEIQVSRPRAAFSLSLRDHKLTLPSRETLVQRCRLSHSQEAETCQLGRSDCVDRARPITVIVIPSCNQDWFDDYCG